MLGAILRSRIPDFSPSQLEKRQLAINCVWIVISGELPMDIRMKLSLFLVALEAKFKLRWHHLMRASLLYQSQGKETNQDSPPSSGM